MKDIYPYVKKIKLPVETNFYTDIEETYYGQVDHQSRGFLQRILDHYKITLKEFITDHRYVIMVDGDEYDVFGDLIRNKFITKENTEDIYRNYGRRFDWEKKGEDAE